MAAASPTIAVVAKLKATAAVVAVVAQRIYPQKVTQEPEAPAIVIRILGASGNKPIKAGNSPLKRYTVQIDCYAETEIEGQALGKLVREALTPDVTSWQDAANGVQGCFHQDTITEESADGFRYQSEVFDLWHMAT